MQDTKNDLEFVIVTGVTGFFGAHLCRELIQTGFGVIGTYRSEKQLSHLKEFLAENNIDPENTSFCIFFRLDLGKANAEVQIHDFFQKLLEQKLNICHLINNAALDNQDPIENIRAEKMKHLFQVNVFSPIFLSKEFVNLTKGNMGQRCILNITSLLASFGDKKSSLYGSTKAALEGFGRNISVELGEQQIRVINIEVCNFPNILISDESPHSKRSYKNIQSNKGDTVCFDPKDSPLGYIISFSQFTKPIVFLLSKGASYITGTTIHIDGGVSVKR